MQTVVLAAGRASRMGVLADETPAGRRPAAGEPYTRRPPLAGASLFVVGVGCGADQVRSVFGDSRAGVPIEYCHQTEQRGAADGVLTARSLLDDEDVGLTFDGTGYERVRSPDLDQYHGSVLIEVDPCLLN